MLAQDAGSFQECSWIFCIAPFENRKGALSLFTENSGHMTTRAFRLLDWSLICLQILNFTQTCQLYHYQHDNIAPTASRIILFVLNGSRIHAPLSVSLP